MLTLLLLGLLLLLSVEASLYSFLFFICVTHLYYTFSVSSTCSSLFTSYLIYDEFSFFIIYIICFLLFISFIYSSSYNNSITFTFFFMFFFCFLVFTTNNIFILYIAYEASLLPILYIIINWGSYPERSISSLMLLIYTVIFTLPFIYFLLYYIFQFSSTSLYFLSPPSISFIFTLVLFLAFAVNLPIYGLHFWLPMAHVEAPTFGSIILAGILLNLGGIGLIRFSPLIDVPFLNSVFLSYLIVFSILVTLVCCFQSDFNRIVAYSSVSHIITIPILVIGLNILSLNSILIIIFLHGLSSPVLFMIVGVIYQFTSTRQLLSLRGFIIISPLLSFIIILAFFFTISTPPFPSFVAEVFFIVSTYFLSPYTILLFISLPFLSLVYNINWLSSILFSSNSPSYCFTSSSVTFLSFIPLFLSFLMCIPFSFLFYFI